MRRKQDDDYLPDNILQLIAKPQFEESNIVSSQQTPQHRLNAMIKDESQRVLLSRSSANRQGLRQQDSFQSGGVSFSNNFMVKKRQIPKKALVQKITFIQPQNATQSRNLAMATYTAINNTLFNRPQPINIKLKHQQMVSNQLKNNTVRNVSKCKDKQYLNKKQILPPHPKPIEPNNILSDFERTLINIQIKDTNSKGRNNVIVADNYSEFWKTQTAQRVLSPNDTLNEFNEVHNNAYKVLKQSEISFTDPKFATQVGSKFFSQRNSTRNGENFSTITSQKNNGGYKRLPSKYYESLDTISKGKFGFIYSPPASKNISISKSPIIRPQKQKTVSRNIFQGSGRATININDIALNLKQSKKRSINQRALCQTVTSTENLNPPRFLMHKRPESEQRKGVAPKPTDQTVDPYMNSSQVYLHQRTTALAQKYLMKGLNQVLTQQPSLRDLNNEANQRAVSAQTTSSCLRLNNMVDIKVPTAVASINEQSQTDGNNSQMKNSHIMMQEQQTQDCLQLMSPNTNSLSKRDILRAALNSKHQYKLVDNPTQAYQLQPIDVLDQSLLKQASGNSCAGISQPMGEALQSMPKHTSQRLIRGLQMRKLKDILEKKAKDNRKKYEEVVTKKNNWLNGSGIGNVSTSQSLDTSKISKQQNQSQTLSPKMHYERIAQNRFPQSMRQSVEQKQSPPGTLMGKPTQLQTKLRLKERIDRIKMKTGILSSNQGDSPPLKGSSRNIAMLNSLKSRFEPNVSPPPIENPVDNDSDGDSSAAKRRSCFKKIGNIQHETFEKRSSFIIKPVEAQQTVPVKSVYSYNACIGVSGHSDNSSAEGKPQVIMNRRSSINKGHPEPSNNWMVRLTPKLQQLSHTRNNLKSISQTKQDFSSNILQQYHQQLEQDEHIQNSMRKLTDSINMQLRNKELHQTYLQSAKFRSDNNIVLPEYNYF